jgi:hypothetical protein
VQSRLPVEIRDTSSDETAESAARIGALVRGRRQERMEKEAHPETETEALKIAIRVARSSGLYQKHTAWRRSVSD